MIALYSTTLSLNRSFTVTVAMSFFLQPSCWVRAVSFALLWASVYTLPKDPQQSFSSYDYGIDRRKIIKRQSSTPFATTGIQTGSGPNASTPLRLEIRDLELDPTTWTLYILGLDMLQYTDQAEVLSWYQITGLHHSLCCHSATDKHPRNSWTSICSFR
jgi:hypothetical protein